MATATFYLSDGKKKAMPNDLQETEDKILKSQDEKGIDLNEPGVPNQLADRIKDEINSHTAIIYDDGFRWHLGASQIGNECKRALWYGFRWTGAKPIDGRLQRLFNRGHLEELRHSEWLKGIGFTVWTHDESITKSDGTHPQLRIKGKCKGHLGGSLDGIVQFPERYRVDGYAILESKTSGTGRGFNETLKEPIQIAKPQHYAQNSLYGYDYGIEWVLYICANKNDDDLAIKVEKLDFDLAKRLILKAEEIIFSQEPPARISENANFMQCKSLCEFKDICHFQKPAVKNCRSCVNCSAVDNAEFFCSVHVGIIPRDFVKDGCDTWQSITIAKPKIIAFEIKSGNPPA